MLNINVISSLPEKTGPKHNPTRIDKPWFVYLVRTRSQALYCGITNDLDRRFAQHQSGKGAKYLRGKGPLTLAWSKEVGDKSTALKEEIRIKKLPKQRKEMLIVGRC
ncbi:GIY-YIG nuclease family protein [Vibrio gangliei]|uniref:GIY-YIG nuclease family protein n=1 Tax=Vibrio gangliei TaxID=2077090 RepID=UPI000D01952D|nr:GIY-YIG nuclease family protein [Vibrio gangliei]